MVHNVIIQYKYVWESLPCWSFEEKRNYLPGLCKEIKSILNNGCPEEFWLKEALISIDLRVNMKAWVQCSYIPDLAALGPVLFSASYQLALNIKRFCVHRFNQLWIENIQKIKISESSTKQNVNVSNSKHYAKSMQIKWKYRLYANTEPFYIKNLSICGYWYL